jgi:hypothetical protein
LDHVAEIALLDVVNRRLVLLLLLLLRRRRWG